MAVLALAAAGALIAPAGYAAVGWAVGSAIGSMLQGPTKVQGQQQSLMDLKVTGADYGQAIPYVRGAAAIAGQMWWNTDRRPTTTTTTESSGGKGGGGVETSTSTITYDMDCLIGLTDNEIIGIARIWDQGKLIYTADSGATAGSIAASQAANAWTRLTVYTGSMTQLPDPTYEAAVGTANAPAYRGRSYVFIEGLKLGQSGQVRNLTFEVVADGTTGISAPTLGAMPSVNSWRDIAYGNGTFCTITNGGGSQVLSAVTSNVGASWTQSQISTWTQCAAIDWNGSVFCAVGQYHAATSTDGISWTVQAGIPARNWIDVCWTGAVFCAIEYGGNHVATSPDGITWAEYASLPASAYWRHIAAGGGVLVALADSSSNAAYSPNGGITWNSVTMPQVGSWGGIAWNGSIFVTTDINDTSFTSADGTAWTPHAMGVTSTFGQQIAYDVVSGLFCIPSLAGIVAISDDGITWATANIDPGAFTGDSIASANGVFILAGSGGSKSYTFSGSAIILTPSAVPTVVSALCLRAGLAAGQIDVTDLSSITRTVRCLPISQIAPTRQALELLMSTYFFEMTLSDKLYFRPRGGSSVASIPYLDLGASVGDEPSEPLALHENNDLEIPAQIALSYINVSDDYQTGTEPSDRLISATAGTVNTVQMAIGMTPEEAKGVADTMLFDQYASRWSAPIALLGNYCRLEPTDPIVVTGADGSAFRLRIVKKTDSYPLLTFETVLDDVSVLTSQGITSADYTSSTVVAAAVNTEMELMDIPILQDADNDPGFYVAAKGDATNYPGSAIFNSADNVEYVRKATVLESAVFGTCTTTLGDWTGGRVFDEQNSVTVNVGDGTLASTTRDAVLNSLSVNAMLVGSELIQFLTVTLVSAGVYTLTSLLRGGRGTEWAMTGHIAAERCVLLRAVGLRRIAMPNSELGLSRYYKGVTLGRAVSSATAEQFTDNAIGLKPFSPFDLRATRDGSNNITFTWQRRTRLATRMIGTLGISMPLGEESESYEIDIYASGAYATVVRTISATSETTSYTAAQQTADGLAPGNTVYCKAYQLSVQVGRGYPFQQAV